MAKKVKCEKCEGSQVVNKDGEMTPCPALAVSPLGRLACLLPDGTFDAKAENRSILNARMQKDKAYEERNKVVAAFAKAVVKLGGRAGRRKTTIKDWNPEWAWALDVIAPGQPSWSWHYHESHAPIFEKFPLATWEWDGTDTPTKYKLMEEWNP